MSRFAPRVVLFCVAGAALAGLLLGAKMIDLDVYRAGASAVLAGSDLYSVVDPATGLPFTYPVFAAVGFVPLAIVPLAVARVLITLLSIGALAIICALTLREVRPRVAAGLARTSWPPRWRRLARGASIGRGPTGLVGGGLVGGGLVVGVLALLMATAHPVMDTLLFGQINLILAALVLLDTVGRTGRWRGVLVGIAAGLKLTPGLFVVYFVVTGQWRAARNAALTTAGTVALGFVVQPDAAWDFWTRHMLDPARTGNVTYAGNQSLLATTARLLRDEQPPPLLTLALSALVVVAALVLARLLDRRGERLAAVCVVAAATLLASPISWTHHWVWFIPAAAVLVAWAVGDGWRTWQWVALGAGIAVIWSGPMRFMPKNDLLELRQNTLQQAVTNSFTLLALGFLGIAAARLGRRRPSRRRVDEAPPLEHAPTIT